MERGALLVLITLDTLIDAAPERCFDLSLSVRLHLDSTAHTDERVVAGPTTGLLDLGDTVTWEARHLGRRRRLTVQITGLDRPEWFRDTDGSSSVATRPSVKPRRRTAGAAT